ncbi:phosphonate utilization associated putative membrane protein [Thalassovita gelatinovora]|uniref:Phosphonate utilization associated putative membrane protein n=1 Tax=Thalassovita gelatinovora TaxID=53501 RepID=A0A0P1G0U1_THAGE|nr:DMT family transporter [Thalassovita gelatinovora]QIZ80412.1 DMT family transporter [Thalassovita gelatinovora]CUH65785.1 phosphonate utilization associated putative membrane protein [Thalassovita gelatinovora]SEQ71864.1 S-adenosylmethionine uptake transporter [Thalassovita gelatinovora]
MPLSDNMRGALLMMASMAAFTINDTFMKVLSGDVPLFQLLFLRGILTSLFTGVWAWRLGVLHFRLPRRDLGLIALRIVAEIGSAYFFLTALFHMPIANVTAILQSLPLTVSLLAALLFRESLGWRRMSAILVGLLGVLLIVRPGAEGFTLYSVYALIAVGFVTMRDLVTRRLSRSTPSMLVTWTTSMSVMVFFGLAGLGRDWVEMDVRTWGVIVASSVSIIAGYLCSVLVMRVGEISFIAPFRYTGLIWALTLGWFVFGDWPAPLTLIGAAIVVCSGVFMLYREGQIAKQTKRNG